MDCLNCELKQRQFFCDNCLKTHIRDLKHQIQHFVSDRQDQVNKANKALEFIGENRRRRATYAEYQIKVEELQNGLARLRRDNEKKRDRLRELREDLAARRRTLSAAKLLQPPAVNHAITREIQEVNSLSVTLARARSGLVQELVEVFNVVEVGGRPPIGGKAGTKGEWTIGDLILPVPGDIRRYPPDHINAVITHAIHFLSLLTFYLGIKLPFEISWSGGKLGVGQPSIGAGKGAETGGWAKWHTKHPLHLSSNPTPASPTTVNSPSSSATSQSQARDQKPIPISHSLSESFVESDPGPQLTFTTALAMLLYNVCYLAHTQNVEVPLSQAGEVLSILWSVCCSVELGKKSHETSVPIPVPIPNPGSGSGAGATSATGGPVMVTSLPPPTPPTFPLDFAQLLQATTANPASRSHRSRPSRGSKPRRLSVVATPRKDVSVVLEEEDGWDMVDGDGDHFGDP